MDAPATNRLQPGQPGNDAPATAPSPAREDVGDVIALMELLFFAYRDFIAEPDTMLAELGFGRAHHRILHFVGRHPGLRVSELLAILRITKQSLGRVLRELIDRGYVKQTEGATDRRQRLLHLTPAGRELLERLERPQIERVRRALEQAGPGAREAFHRVLLALVDENERDHVAALCGLAMNDHLQKDDAGKSAGSGPARADRG